MSKLRLVSVGQLKPMPVGQSESAIVHASGVIRPEQPAQVLEDISYFVEAGSHAVVDAVSFRHLDYEEKLPETVLERTHDITAYIDRYVPIPWLHGSQSVTG